MVLMADPGGERPVALITGATGGMGRAIAARFARAGSDLILAARSEAALAELQDELGGAATSAVVCDLAKPEDVERLAAAAFGAPRLDLVVHAAGAYASGTWENSPAGSLRALLAVNVEAPAALSRRLLPAIRQSRGQIVFVNSTQGLRGTAEVGAYAASKHAMKAVAETLRQELRGTGVRVLTVFPGSTATPMQQAIQRQKGRSWDPGAFIQPDDVAAMIMAAVTLPRTAEVVDMTILPAERPPN